MSTKCSNSSSNATNISNTTSITSFSAKLRRLRIEEGILLQSINKGTSTGFQSGEAGATENVSYLEFNTFLCNTKNSYKQLKQLFEDIKASTSSKEVLKAIDIDEIKKSTHELENNIKSYKIYLHTEMNELKSAERQLNQQLHDPILISNLKRKTRVQTAKYTEIVPSPVKTLMSSPFKCVEVQEFQEFMKNSRNRYGGWNEYHHNIFVNIWQKHFDATSASFSNMMEYSEEFNSFLRELIPKLLGVSREDVLAHIKWYTKYVNLKDRQQKAIDKWRSNRRKMTKHIHDKFETENVGHIEIKCAMKKSANRDSVNKIVSDYLNPKEELVLSKDKGRVARTCLSKQVRQKLTKDCCCDDASYDQQTSVNFLKSTKQWDIRCSSAEIINKANINDVENIKKLRTPMWRIGL